MSQFDPGSVPPAIPVPVQALPYSVPAQYGRPGLVTAIGVLSIVVACLSGFGSLITGMYGFGFWMMSRMSASMSTPSSMVVTANAGPGSPNVQSLPVADASVAVNELTKTLSLDGPRIRELDKLLRLHGREVLGGDEDTPVSAASVRAAVTGQGRNADGSVNFTTAQGRVDIYTNRAAYVSTDGTTRISTSASNNSGSVQQANSGTAGIGTSTTLTEDQIVQVLNSAVRLSPAPLNDQQVAALRAELSKPNQQLVRQTANPTASFVNNMGGQTSASIGFDSGNVLMVDPQGRVTVSGPTPMPKIGISGSTAGMVMGEAAGSLALAIYLLVLGILVFRSSRSVPRLLGAYALLKIPLAILAGAALSLMGSEFASSMAGSGGAPASAAFMIWGIGIAVLGCAFPIGLLIALHTRTVKDYFGSVVR